MERCGHWRTIGGRKVFIATGQSVSEAMRESGKFPSYKKNKERKAGEKYDKVNEEEAELNSKENAKIREYREQGMSLEDAVNKADKEFENKRDAIINKRAKVIDDLKKKEDIIGARGGTKETQETKINRAVYDLQSKEKEIERKTGNKNPFVDDEYIKEYRNFDKKLNKIKSLDDNERYYYTSSGGGFRNKFRNTWGEKGEKDISVSARMYTNDEFMEHLEDANWHSERSMLEKAGLTNKQMSYIKDQVYVSAWGVDNLDLKRTEQLIKEAKIKYPKEINPTKYSVTSASISRYQNMFNEYKKLHPNTKMDLQKFARMMMDLG